MTARLAFAGAPVASLRSMLRLLKRRTRGRQPLSRLADVHREAARAPRRWLGLRTIAVDEIVGSASMPVGTRRSDFLPPENHAPAGFEQRWDALRSAIWDQHHVPPIDVVKVSDGYWVLDGHNRVALAVATGQEWIDAEVTEIFLPPQGAEPGARPDLQPREEPIPMPSRSTRAAAAAAAIVTLSAFGPAPAAAVEVTQACTNPQDGYTVKMPAGWYYNERVEGGELDDIAACRFFSPSDFEVHPASDATGIAISIGHEATAPRAEGHERSVGGKPTTVIETVASEDGFEPAGTRHYQYWIDIGDDWLVADTSDAPNYVGDYDENKAVLDAMMDSLAFSPGGLPDTAMGASGSGWSGLVLGAAVPALGFVAGRARSRLRRSQEYRRRGGVVRGC